VRGAFEDEELKPVKSRRDTELTLGSGALLAILLGLVVLCVVCFGLGYTVGQHGSSAAAAVLPAPSQPAEAGNAIAKPPATAQADPAQSLDAEDSAQPQDGAAPAANGASVGQVVPVAGSVPGEPGQPAVHPALASVPAANQPVPAPALQPAVAQGSAAPAGSLMVQIAAVSNVEDARVLADALRKHGYAVVARRDPADDLIHVRIGPFATLAEANSWRMKLLNDGYNAIVQQ
jgi:cell division septation protein DedD